MSRNDRSKSWEPDNTHSLWLRRSRGGCSTGKWQYLDRSSAKKSGRFRGQKFNQYECSECGFIHNGRLPSAVVRGEVSRGEYYGMEERYDDYEDS